MKKLISLLAILIVSFSLQSQNISNPYASIGKRKPKVATVTNGSYNEFYIKDSLVLINDNAISRKTGDIVFSKKDNPKIIAELIQKEEDKFRFLSTDPLTKSFPMLTPYQYASNRPIDGIDLDGLEYVNATLANDNFFSLLGLTFKDDVAKQSWIQSNSVAHGGSTYIKTGFHIYMDSNGNLSKTKTDGSSKISQWVYNSKAVLDSKTDKFFGWKAPDVLGSNESGLANNENCNYLACEQAKESGAKVMKGASNRVLFDNYEAAEDFINTQIEAGYSAAIGVNIPSESKEHNKDGTDHFIAISGRGSDSNGDYFTYWDNATSDAKRGQSSENKLYIKNGTISGSAKFSNGVKIKYEVLTGQKNKTK